MEFCNQTQLAVIFKIMILRNNKYYSTVKILSTKKII